VRRACVCRVAGCDIGILPLCRALIGGGGLKNLQSIMVLDGTLVQANQAQYGSGIDISNAGNAGMPCPTIVLAQNSIFSLNSATEKGAGFSIFNIYLASFTNVTFDSNFGELWPDQGRTLCVPHSQQRLPDPGLRVLFRSMRLGLYHAPA